MLLAESDSFDRLITLVQLLFVSTALPGVIGVFLPRAGGVTFFLGLLSALSGIGLLSWMIWERSTVPTFYLAAGTPLLVGTAACLRGGRVWKKPGPLPSTDRH